MGGEAYASVGRWIFLLLSAALEDRLYEHITPGSGESFRSPDLLKEESYVVLKFRSSCAEHADGYPVWAWAFVRGRLV